MSYQSRHPERLTTKSRAQRVRASVRFYVRDNAKLDKKAAKHNKVVLSPTVAHIYLHR